MVIIRATKILHSSPLGLRALQMPYYILHNKATPNSNDACIKAFYSKTERELYHRSIEGYYHVTKPYLYVLPRLWQQIITEPVH